MLLFLDWDETLTETDTLSLIPSPRPLHGPSFDHYTGAYLADLDEHSRTHPLGDSDKRRDLKSQITFLESLEAVEMASVQRVERGGLFIDWDPQDAERRAAQKVRLRAGVSTDLSAFLAEYADEVHTTIVSASWSARFIQAGLKSGGVPVRAIRANEVEVDERGLGTGRMSKSAKDTEGVPLNESGEGLESIRTGIDKLRQMRSLIKNRISQDGNLRSGELVVFAGDSNTDLPCLLAASIGIVVASDSEGSLEATLRRLNLTKRLAAGPADLSKRLRVAEWKPTRFTCDADVERNASANGLVQQTSEQVVLVKVADWMQGTRVLEGILTCF